MKKTAHIAILILILVSSTAFFEATASSNYSSGNSSKSSKNFPVYEDVQEGFVGWCSCGSSLSVDELVRRYGCPGISPANPSTDTSKRVRDYSAAPPTIPVTGVRSILVILIDFSDKTGSLNHSHYQSLLFGEEKSLKDYYREVSYNQLNVQGKVSGTGWYRSNHNMTWWGADSSGHDDLNGDIFELAREAVTLADSDINFREYDTDGDKILDPEELSICIVHAGLGQESSRVASDIWSHRWYIYGQGYQSRGIPLSDTLVDGIRISKHEDPDDVGGYFMVAEDSPLGTFAHEFGHELGLPDLYDYSGGEEFVGKWDLMGKGNWNGNPKGSSPAHLMAWSKLKLGWIGASNITSISSRQVVNTTIDRLETVTKGFYAAKIVVGSIYYLVEVRQQVLYDTYLPSQGILISFCNDSVETGKGPVRVQNANLSVPSLDDAAFNIGAGENSTFIDRVRGITVTLLSSNSSSFRIKVNYEASSVTVQTLPVSLQVEVNGTVYNTPKTFYCAAGTSFTVNALSPHVWDRGTRFVFVGWSDGGSQTHAITTSVSDHTLTATYGLQYYLNTSSPYGEVTGSGWYDNGSTAYVSLDTVIVSAGNGSRLRFSHWGGNASGTDFTKSDPITMNEPGVAIALWKRQYEVFLSFKTSDGLVSVFPSQCAIAGAAPNSTTLTLGNYSNLWLDDVSWTLVQVLWQGNNIIPNTTISNTPQPTGTWIVNCSVYRIDFANSFRNSVGDALYVNPSHFALVCPNGTETLPLSIGNYSLQVGSYNWSHVFWKDVDVTPRSTTSFNPVRGSPTLNCTIYNLVVSVEDYLGFPVSGVPTDVVYVSSETTFVSTTTNSTGKARISQLPEGSYRVDVAFLGFHERKSVELVGDKTLNIKVALSYPLIGLFAVQLSLVILILLFIRRKFRSKGS